MCLFSTVDSTLFSLTIPVVFYVSISSFPDAAISCSNRVEETKPLNNEPVVLPVFVTLHV